MIARVAQSMLRCQRYRNRRPCPGTTAPLVAVGARRAVDGAGQRLPWRMPARDLHRRQMRSPYHSLSKVAWQVRQARARRCDGAGPVAARSASSSQSPGSAPRGSVAPDDGRVPRGADASAPGWRGSAGILAARRVRSVSCRKSAGTMRVSVRYVKADLGQPTASAGSAMPPVPPIAAGRSSSEPVPRPVCLTRRHREHVSQTFMPCVSAARCPCAADVGVIGDAGEARTGDRRDRRNAIEGSGLPGNGSRPAPSMARSALWSFAWCPVFGSADFDVRAARIDALPLVG